MTARWPTTLLPTQCTFGRSRNPGEHTSETTRQIFLTARGRPLWTCKCTWELLPEQENEFRLVMESLDGMVVGRVMWDFANPYAKTSSAVLPVEGYRWQKGLALYRWKKVTTPYLWRKNLPLYGTFSGTIAVAVAASAGAMSVSLSGMPASKTLIDQGDYIQLGEKLYIVAAKVTTNSSGAATVTLTTPLVVAVNPGDEVRLKDAGCAMRMMDGSWKSSRSWDGAFVTASADFLEIP